MVWLFAGILALLSVPAAAQERVTLGWGRIFANDGLGDAKDRWRTGAYTLSRIRGPGWTGTLPGFGEILEFRAKAEIVAPEHLVVAAPGDRRYAGILSFGLHTHFDMAGFDTSLGGELAITGKQTGLAALQGLIHRSLGLADPKVDANQIGNHVYPGVVAEIGRSMALGEARLRPFVEARAGLETLVRAGFDLEIGGYTQGALMLRESTTGQRYRGVAGDLVPGWSASVGGDIAHVFDSKLLPEGGAAVLSEDLARLRLGVAWQGESGASVFYGVTWLGREFEGQHEGQAVGTLNLNLKF